MNLFETFFWQFNYYFNDTLYGYYIIHYGTIYFNFPVFLIFHILSINSLENIKKSQGFFLGKLCLGTE